MIDCPCWGANAHGFHGAGKAGLMWRGIAENTWRDDLEFQGALRELKAKLAGDEYVPELLVGLRAVLGDVGLMKGEEGWSYGLVTTERPGVQGVITDDVITYEIFKMFRCARVNRDKQFNCLDFGLKRPEGYSWWSRDELKGFWMKAVDMNLGLPKNVMPPPFMFRV